jgi:hypothetical protein
MKYQNWNRYKSRGEGTIASYLEQQDIDFTYEKPIAVVDSGKTKIWYPDFYLDNYHILIEYLGMNHNPHNTRINEHKRKVYRHNRIDVVEIYPEDFKGDWQGIIDSGIYNTLENRLTDYISKSYRRMDHNNYRRSFRHSC